MPSARRARSAAIARARTTAGLARSASRLAPKRTAGSRGHAKHLSARLRQDGHHRRAPSPELVEQTGPWRSIGLRGRRRAHSHHGQRPPAPHHPRPDTFAPTAKGPANLILQNGGGPYTPLVWWVDASRNPQSAASTRIWTCAARIRRHVSRLPYPSDDQKPGPERPRCIRSPAPSNASGRRIFASSCVTFAAGFVAAATCRRGIGCSSISVSVASPRNDILPQRRADSHLSSRSLRSSADPDARPCALVAGPGRPLSTFGQDAVLRPRSRTQETVSAVCEIAPPDQARSRGERIEQMPRSHTQNLATAL